MGGVHYCLEHLWQVIKYTLYLLLHVRWWHIYVLETRVGAVEVCRHGETQLWHHAGVCTNQLVSWSVSSQGDSSGSVTIC